MAARRDEVYLTAFNSVFNSGIGSDRLHSALLGETRYRRHRPHPDDVVQTEVVGIDDFLAGLQVYGRGKTGFIDAEEIQPGAVLTPFVAIVPVLGGRIHITKHKDHSLAALHLLHQRSAPCDIYFFLKHTRQI